MKKLIIPGLALCLLLSACGGSPTVKAFDPNGAPQALVDSGAFSVALEELDATALYDLEGYGLDPAALTDSAARSASGYAEQVSVTVWRTEADAEKAVTAFGEYLQDMKDAYKEYAAAEVGKLDAAIVERRGTSILLVVPGDTEAATAAVERLK